jgi:two-component system OmpR family sensor kinase
MVLLTVGLTLLGVALGLSVTYWSLIYLRLADLDDDNRVLAEVILEATLAQPQYEVPAVVEGYLVRNTGVSTAYVFRNGELLWHDDLFEVPVPLDPEGLAEGGGTRLVGSWRVYTLSRGDLTVQVGRRTTNLQAVLRPYEIISLVLLVVLAVLCGLLAWWASGLALRPLHALTEATRTFDPDAFLPVISGKDEAATLTQSFRMLLEQLQNDRRREQQFLAYAAHELRTPITALRASLQAARLREAPPDPRLLDRLHHDALRLETLAQNLLALSRAEAHEIQLRPLDLADIASTAYDRFQPLALETGHELVLEAEPAPVTADPRLLEQVLNNLLINAIRYTSGEQIVIRCGMENGQAFIEVEDKGDGLPTLLKEGLGLRVVRAVARAHQGSFDMKGENSTRARLWLDAA